MEAPTHKTTENTTRPQRIQQKAEGQKEIATTSSIEDQGASGIHSAEMVPKVEDPTKYQWPISDFPCHGPPPDLSDTSSESWYVSSRGRSRRGSDLDELEVPDQVEPEVFSRCWI